MLGIANFKVAIINMFGELMENISVLINRQSQWRNRNGKTTNENSRIEIICNK